MFAFDYWVPGPTDEVLALLRADFQGRSGAAVTASRFDVPLGFQASHIFLMRATGRFEPSAAGVRVVGVVEESPASKVATVVAAVGILAFGVASSIRDGGWAGVASGLFGAGVLWAAQVALRPRALRTAGADFHRIVAQARQLADLYAEAARSPDDARAVRQAGSWEGASWARIARAPHPAVWWGRWESNPHSVTRTGF